MKMNTLMKYLLAVAVITLGIGGYAQAATINLNLNGTVSNGVSINFTSDSTHYDYWSLNLSGGAISVSPGDEIIATVTLDQLLSLPITSPSTGNPLNLTWVEIALRGPSFPSVDTQTNTVQAVFSSGLTIDGAQSTTTNGVLIQAVTFAPQALSFDKLVMDFTIPIQDDKNQFGIVDLDGFQLNYWLFSKASETSPVPEPATMLLLGLGLAGLAGIRNRLS